MRQTSTWRDMGGGGGEVRNSPLSPQQHSWWGCYWGWRSRKLKWRCVDGECWGRKKRKGVWLLDFTQIIWCKIKKRVNTAPENTETEGEKMNCKFFTDNSAVWYTNGPCIMLCHLGRIFVLDIKFKRFSFHCFSLLLVPQMFYFLYEFSPVRCNQVNEWHFKILYIILFRYTDVTW